MPNRRALFDIGAGGPWAGVCASVLVGVVGLFSQNQALANQFGPAIFLGLIVTIVNLFPFGQLDGGHVFYAFFGRNDKLWRLLFLVFTFLATIFFQHILGPFVFLVMILFGGVNHRPTSYDAIPLGGLRKLGAFATLALYVFLFWVMHLFSVASVPSVK